MFPADRARAQTLRIQSSLPGAAGAVQMRGLVPLWKEQHKLKDPSTESECATADSSHNPSYLKCQITSETSQVSVSTGEELTSINF